MAKRNYDHLFKILLIGDSGVGKPELLFRFCDDSFNSAFISTIGQDFRIRTLELNGKIIKLQVWDTAGQERFRTMTRTYYKGTHGVVLVYDITDAESFEHASGWMRTINENRSEDIDVMLLGNNCEKENERMVLTEQAQKFADGNGMRFFEVSPKNNTNVDVAFTTLTSDILQKVKNKKEERSIPDNKDKKAEKLCCIS